MMVSFFTHYQHSGGRSTDSQLFWAEFWKFNWPPQESGRKFTIFGKEFGKVYVNNNGMLSFENGIQAQSSLPYNLDNTYPEAAIAPFWADVSTYGGSCGRVTVCMDTNLEDINRYVKQVQQYQGVNYSVFEATNSFVVTWEDVCQGNTWNNDRNTFQVALGCDHRDARSCVAVFNYEKMDWATYSAEIGFTLGNQNMYHFEFGELPTSWSSCISILVTNNPLIIYNG